MKEPYRHNLPDDFQLDYAIENEYATVYFYGNLVILEANEGVSFSIKTGISLLIKAIAYLGSKPVVLISNRVNSYSVIPTDYKYLEHVPTLKGIAVVYHSEDTKAAATLEANFFKKPFRLFSDIQGACLWARELL